MGIAQIFSYCIYSLVSLACFFEIKQIECVNACTVEILFNISVKPVFTLNFLVFTNISSICECVGTHLK